MNILVIDPLSELGHKNFTTYLLNILSGCGEVSFVTKKGYLDKENNKYKILHFPNKFFKISISKFSFRLRQIIYIYSIYKDIKKEKKYDLILFTSYETISFAVSTLFFNINKVYVIEHNNIDQIVLNKVKSWFYQRINNEITHIAFEKYITTFLQVKYGKKTLYLPHPFYKYSNNDFGKNKVIFSPSSTYKESVAEKLIEFCKKNDYYLIAKGKQEVISERIIVRPFFNNYYQNIEKSTLIFISNFFLYRVSGVAFDALAYGRPIVGFRSLFLEELKKQYCYIVFVIDDVNEIKNIKFNLKKMKLDFYKFKKEHGEVAILEQTKFMMKD